MKKKLVVVLMAAVMAMTAVTGCGSKADDAKNDTQASKASESETSANADQEAAMHVADLIDASTCRREQMIQTSSAWRLRRHGTSSQTHRRSL